MWVRLGLSELDRLHRLVRSKIGSSWVKMVKIKKVYNILIGQKKKKKLVGVQILIG